MSAAGRAHGDPVTPRMMKDVLGNFGTGVTVITAIGPDGPLGFTCQTFASLSLDPPLVSFCPARTSTTWPRIRALGRFTINILAHHHGGLSENFAQVGPAGSNRFDGVGFTLSPGGGPVLEGVLAWVDCRWRAEHDGGDHTIVVADVVDLEAVPDVMPLFYFRGGYLRRGDVGHQLDGLAPNTRLPNTQPPNTQQLNTQLPTSD